MAGTSAPFLLNSRPPLDWRGDERSGSFFDEALRTSRCLLRRLRRMNAGLADNAPLRDIPAVDSEDPAQAEDEALKPESVLRKILFDLLGPIAEIRRRRTGDASS